MLQTVPSFSIYGDNNHHELQGHENNEQGLMRTITIGDRIEGKVSGDFSSGMGLIEEKEDEEKDQEASNGIESLNLDQVEEPVSPPMYLASGLGISDIDFGRGHGEGGAVRGVFDSFLPNLDGSDDVEEYYKKMVHEFPCHPLFLANYAQLLQTKGDLQGAEEYYHRATMADPENGKILMKYAKIDWQLHHDQDRALSNFERAVQVAPHNSQVLAGYASFLWEIDTDGDEYNSQLTMDVVDDASCTNNNGYNIDEYYKKIVEENPSDSSVLQNYAQFLYKKGDLEGSEKYYSRAVLANPMNGETKLRYAKLIWDLHRDHDKALNYFEQAVEAAPQDSHVIGAYASFLWETEENEEDSTSLDQNKEAIDHESSATAGTARL